MKTHELDYVAERVEVPRVWGGGGTGTARVPEEEEEDRKWSPKFWPSHNKLMRKLTSF
jgi:hypothetical protein